MFGFDLQRLFKPGPTQVADSSAAGLASWGDATIVKPANSAFTQTLGGETAGLNINDPKKAMKGTQQIIGAFGGGGEGDAPPPPPDTSEQTAALDAQYAKEQQAQLAAFQQAIAARKRKGAFA